MMVLKELVVLNFNLLMELIFMYIVLIIILLIHLLQEDIILKIKIMNLL